MSKVLIIRMLIIFAQEIPEYLISHRKATGVFNKNVCLIFQFFVSVYNILNIV